MQDVCLDIVSIHHESSGVKHPGLAPSVPIKALGNWPLAVCAGVWGRSTLRDENMDPLFGTRGRCLAVLSTSVWLGFKTHFKWLEGLKWPHQQMLPHREAPVSLSVQRPLAPDHPRYIIDLKQILGVLVHPRSLQLVDHLTCKDFVRFDLDRGRRYDCYNLRGRWKGGGEGGGVVNHML